MKSKPLRNPKTFGLALGGGIALVQAMLSPGLAWSNGSMLGTGLQTMAAVDITADLFARDQTTNPNGLFVREVELGVFAPADALFDGVALLALHREAGVYQPDIHEVYLGSSKLIPNSRFRVGYFFLGFGRLNQFHRHDWPFTSPPKVQSQFFAEEAATDAGVEYSYLVPFLPFYLDLTLGVTSGYVFGHSHTAGVKPEWPTHYLRAAHYVGFSDTSGMQIGLNYVGRKASDTGTTSLLGLDVTAKFREMSQLRWLFQSEAWFRNVVAPTGGNPEQAVGAYVFGAYGFKDSRLEAGLRLDAYSVLSLRNALGNTIGNAELAFVPQLTWRSSEFVTLRASYQANFTSSLGAVRFDNQVLQLQTVFILGAHPAHEF